MSIRVQADGQGGFVTGTPGEMNAAQYEANKVAEATAEPVVRIGGVRTRYQVDGDGIGRMTTISDGQPPRHAAPATAGDPLDTGRSEAGQQLTRYQLDENSIIDHPGLGGSMRLKEALNLGWVRPTPNGFEMWGEMAGLGTAAAPAGTKPTIQPKPDAAASDDADISTAGIPGTSASADLFANQTRKAVGEAVYTGLVHAYATGADPTAMVAEIARTTGQSEAEIRQGTDDVFAEKRAAAIAVVTKHGVPQHALVDFEKWATDRDKDAVLDAYLAIDNFDIAPLARLAKQYARTGRAASAFGDEAIMNAQFGPGIKAVQTEKGVMLDIKDRGLMSVKRAVEAGLIKIR